MAWFAAGLMAQAERHAPMSSELPDRFNAGQVYVGRITGTKAMLLVKEFTSIPVRLLLT